MSFFCQKLSSWVEMRRNDAFASVLCPSWVAFVVSIAYEDASGIMFKVPRGPITHRKVVIAPQGSVTAPDGLALSLDFGDSMGPIRWYNVPQHDWASGALTTAQCTLKEE